MKKVDLFQAPQEEWLAIPAANFEKLADSIVYLCATTVRSKGWPTKYYSKPLLTWP